MKCNQCRTTINEGDEREHNGRILCEDCYIDALSPARICDPWAVYNAKSFSKDGIQPAVNKIQAKILRILKETGGLEPEALYEQIRNQVKRSDFEKEIAALRHMEKIRSEKKDDTIICRLW